MSGTPRGKHTFRVFSSNHDDYEVVADLMHTAEGTVVFQVGPTIVGTFYQPVAAWRVDNAEVQE